MLEKVIFTDHLYKQVRALLEHHTNIIKSGIQYLGIEFPTVYLAGGSIRDICINKFPKDWDFFFYTEQERDQWLQYLEKTDLLKHFTKTNNSLTIVLGLYKIQFITKFADKPHFLVRKFDFTFSMAYYETTANNLQCFTAFIKSLETLIIRVNTDCYSPTQSLNRMRKFLKLGWDIPYEDILALTYIVYNKEFKDIKSSKEAISHGVKLLRAGGGY